MPLDYHQDYSSSVVVVRGMGKVTDDDVRRTAMVLYDVAALASEMAVLVDLRAVTHCTVSSDTIRALATLHCQPDTQIGPTRVAIVAPADLAYGLSRMYATLVEGSAIEVEVFRDIDTGHAWLQPHQIGPHGPPFPLVLPDSICEQ